MSARKTPSLPTSTSETTTFKDTAAPLKVPSLISVSPQGELHHLPPTSYEERLTQFLQSCLELPEEGMVKIQLTLSVDGRVRNLTFLSSESDANQRFLRHHLPSLLFPTPEGATTTFTILFRNRTA